jgi:hypothetical protein
MATEEAGGWFVIPSGGTPTIPKEPWMKRRWMTCVFASLTCLAACQVAPGDRTGETRQEISQYCGAQVPPTPFWDGTPLPATGAGQIYLIYEDLTKAGEWVVMLADYGNGKLVSGVRTKSASLAALYSTMSKAAQYAGGRQPNPPGPVGDTLAAALLEWANAASQNRANAEQAAATCVK